MLTRFFASATGTSLSMAALLATMLETTYKFWRPKLHDDLIYSKTAPIISLLLTKAGSVDDTELKATSTDRLFTLLRTAFFLLNSARDALEKRKSTKRDAGTRNRLVGKQGR